METLNLSILTPSKSYLENEEVSSVVLETSSGIIEVLPGHTEIISTLGFGFILYTKANISGILCIFKGVFEVKDNIVKIFADFIEDPTAIEFERAKKSLERAETRLKGETKDIDRPRAEDAMYRANLRMRAFEQSDKLKNSNK